MEKKHTHSDPFRESTRKHSISPPRAEGKTRTSDALERALGMVLSTVTARDAWN
jgi:hypothetical protein